MVNLLLPDPWAIRCHQIRIEPDRVTIEVGTVAPAVPCPLCHRPSGRVHSRYRRNLGDLPWQGCVVRWRLEVRKFFSSSNQEEITRKLKDTVGEVSYFREALRGHDSAFCSVTPETLPGYAQLSNHKKVEAQRIFKSTIGYQSFSDMRVAFSQISIGDGEITLNAVYGLLLGCAFVMLDHLGKSRTPRGAIEVGKGCDFFPNEVYGPVLDHAYRLEKVQAGYPRIVVGPELIRCLDVCANSQDTRFAANRCREIVPLCRKLITIDDEGCSFVDFLGEAHRNHVSEFAPEAVSYARKAFDFVLSQRRRLKTENGIEAVKLAYRYERLIRYFESRVDQWKS